MGTHQRFVVHPTGSLPFGTEGSGGDHTNEIWQRALDVVPQGIGVTRHQSSIRTSGRSALDSRGTAHSFRSVSERGCRDLAANAPSPANAASNRRRLPAGAAERSMSPKAAGVVAPSASDWKATSSASGAARTATSSARRSAGTPSTRPPSTSSPLGPTRRVARATWTAASRRGTQGRSRSRPPPTGCRCPIRSPAEQEWRWSAYNGRLHRRY